MSVTPPPAGAARPNPAASKPGGASPVARRRRRRWLWAGAAVLAVAALGFGAANRPQEVQVSSVLSAYPSAQYGLLTASGYVVAQRRAAVSSKATGRLIELRVREGSVVKAGELIGRLDAADVAATTQAAQAGVRQAEAGKAQAHAGERQAQVELASAETELNRVLALEKQGFVSAQAVDAARRRVDAARATLAAAAAGIASAEGAHAVAGAQLRVQQVQRDNTEIRAPFDGVVLVKNANVGDLITPFSSAGGTQGAVVTMADMGTLEVEADVSEANVAKVRIDMPVEIVLDALPGERFRGTVVRIVPTVDRAKATVMTKVRFEQLDARILPEMSAKVVFLTQRPGDADFKPVVAVNPKAVVEREGRKVVLRIGGSAKEPVVELVPVTPGRTLGDALEVTGTPLKATDRLVLSPGDKLRHGARVALAGK
ncbi:MAG: efflux RND transporter periplasmic adaptor subunit [Rubrivivax sp.]|nr:efflux RND transporter periplasmic adaptor subunit [Rubrivivax sp.]